MRKYPAALAAAAVIVALAATVGFAAGPPSAAEDGLFKAADVSGKDVPLGPPVEPGLNADQPTSDEPEADEPEADEPEADEPEADEPEAEQAENDHCVDPTTLSLETLAETNHGAIVCWAAHQDTPAEFDNHGDYVSSVAKDNHGQETSAAKKAAKGSNGHGKPDDGEESPGG
jgi:hypothetical protein